MIHSNLLTSSEIAALVLNAECSEARQNQIYAMIQQLTAHLALFNETMELVLPGDPFGGEVLPSIGGHKC